VPNRHPMYAMVKGSRRHWIIGVVSGVIALAALIVGSISGTVSARHVDPRIIAWSSAAAILVFGGLASSRLAWAFSHGVASRSIAAAGGAIRILTGALGILFVVFSILAVLRVTIAHLLVGVGLAGVILGIAAQQSLGNIFAGLVLVAARPFRIGDHVRIRSGALGGIFEAWVREMSLTYVTLQTDDGQLKVPNSAMLAAAVGPVQPPPPPPPAPPPATDGAATPAAAPPSSQPTPPPPPTAPSQLPAAQPPATSAESAGRQRP
jgi:small-conductance mechanosensitive channel